MQVANSVSMSEWKKTDDNSVGSDLSSSPLAALSNGYLS